MTAIHPQKYKTFLRPSEGSYREKGSKFLAYLFPAEDIGSVQAHLQDIRKSHPKARHCCYAYRLGFEGAEYRIFDDGEPSGTAGKPIYGQILKSKTTQVLIAVVRYFGGKKLGTSGLIQAYRSAAEDAIQNSKIVTKTVERRLTISFHYEHMNDIMQILAESNATILDKKFDRTGEIELKIPANLVDDLTRKIKSQLLDIHIKQLKEADEVPGLVIKDLGLL
jgi:uncharacterized YigZ family protein